MAAPYRNLGRANAEGTKHYRAYFTADFVWHAALTAELGHFQMPPRNPYMARESLHYYWTYFLVPAAVSSAGPPAMRDVEATLKVNAIATAAVLVAAFFLLAWSAGGGAVAAALAVLLVVLAASAEGAIAIKDLLAKRRAPVEAARHQRRRDHGVEVRRAPHRRRASHDVLHAAARLVVRPGAAGPGARGAVGRNRPAGIDCGQRAAAGVVDHGQPVSWSSLLADLRAGDPRRNGENARLGRADPAAHRRCCAAWPGGPLGHAQRDGGRGRRRPDDRVGGACPPRASRHAAYVARSGAAPRAGRARADTPPADAAGDTSP